MSTLKNVLLGLLPLLVLVAAGELLLWGLGLGDPDAQLSLSRGFDREARYLVPDPEVPGGWRTQMFEKEYLEKRVPPKGGRKRLVLLGGSNTMGFPSEVLQEMLCAADGPDSWEVINLGRAGYGSERVSILLEQSLALQPDVVLVYSGHNEFMERGFAQQLTEEGALTGFGRAADELKVLRVMNVLVSAFEPELRDRSGDRKPEPHTPRDQGFRDLSREQTLTYYRLYGDNLRRMVAAAREAGVGVVLCTVVGNDFVPPYTPGHAEPLGEEDERAFGQAVTRGRKALPERFTASLLPAVHLSQPDWGMTLRPEEIADRRATMAGEQRAVPVLRELSGALAETGATSGPRSASVAGAHWRDPELWVSAVYDVLGTISSIVHADLDAGERAAVQRAIAAYDEALALSPDHALTLFERGLCDYVLGDRAAAAEWWRRARCADRAPRRGTEVSNDEVRAVAAEAGDDVVFVDCDRMFRERCPDGLVGYEVMTDVCHMHPGARVVLMADLAPAVLEAARRTARP